MEDATSWDNFRRINERRRAIRDFDGAPLEDDDVRAVLEEALLAPSSGNLQPYELHWVRDADTRRKVAGACEAQRGALSAATLVVVAASGRIGARTAALQREHVESCSTLDEKTKAYHRKQLDKFGKFLRFAPWMLWSPFRVLMSLFDPVFALLPIGAAGMRNWSARSGIYAAQTLLLAASARGMDSCPMEGFNAREVAKILGLPRGTVVPIVIALGRRSEGARIEPRWRRPFELAVIEH